MAILSSTRLHAFLLIGAIIASSPEAAGQKAKQTVRVPSVPATGIPNPDSLKKYEALLDKGDSVSIDRVLKAESGVQLPPRTAQLYVLAKAKGDSIVLRWAPSTSGGWLSGNKTGYVVSRAALNKDGTVDKGSITTLTTTPSNPMDERRVGAAGGSRRSLGSSWIRCASCKIVRSRDAATFRDGADQGGF